MSLQERKERERAVEGVKEKTENDKKELQISIDKDRDNFTRRLAEEHDQVRQTLSRQHQERINAGCYHSLIVIHLGAVEFMHEFLPSEYRDFESFRG